MTAMKWNFKGFELDLGRLGNITKPVAPPHFEKAHSALQDKFRSSVGFYDWPEVISEEEITAWEKSAKKIRGQLSGAMSIGIGGSYLGGATLVQALVPPDAQDRFPLHWLVNVDGPAILAAEHFLKKRKSAAVVISKSGGTTETLSGFMHLSRHFSPDAIVAITDPTTGELRRLANQNKWQSFPVPPSIGGRFSVLTAVGLYPALLAGVDARAVLEGARAVRAELEKQPIAENAAAWFAYLLYLWDTEAQHSIQFLMPYCSVLERLSDWYVQLWGESLGKKQTTPPYRAVGPTPGRALGTSDQHSLLQLFKEGPTNKVVGFVDVAPQAQSPFVGKPAFAMQGQDHLERHSFDHIARAASVATETSLANSGVPTYRISLPRLDAQALGALFFFFETACAFAGEFYAVNAFDQPGVEESKTLLKASLVGA